MLNNAQRSLLGIRSLWISTTLCCRKGFQHPVSTAVTFCSSTLTCAWWTSCDTQPEKIYIHWSHRCETSHPISIAIPFILTLSIHRNVHYSLLMSPVHGVFCVFWQGGRTSPAIEDGSSDFKAGATSGPCASAVSFCASQEFMPRNIL